MNVEKSIIIIFSSNITMIGFDRAQPEYVQNQRLKLPGRQFRI